ncbi:MAG: hypothetical protein PSX81_02025 [bacterium]|nr:hypothetical protein [bacterium]
MNFLAHYFFDRTDNIYHNVGLVLPDLSRNFCKGHLNLKQEFEGADFNALKSGSLKHLAKDKIFHQSVFFKEAQKSVSLLLDHEAQWPRKWFLNHVLTEIMLDRVLMDANPQLCSDFYRDLGEADPDVIVSFLEKGGVVNAQLFKERYLKFLEYQFIFNYLHNEKLIIALSRLYLKVGIQYEWQKADEDLLNRHFVAILDTIAPQIDYLTKELKLNIDENNKQL